MRHAIILSAAALFTTMASAQTGSIPDPSDPSSAPASEDRTSSGTRDTTASPATRKSDGASTTGRSSSFNAMESAGGTLNDKDATFVKKAASIGLEEVESGKLAADHAADDKVKSFADQMVSDHGQNNDELKSIVEKKGITLPDAPQGKQAASVAQLKSKNGAEFDRAFVAENVKGHQQAIQLFTTASKTAKDPEVKSYAEKTLPTLKHHLEMAQTLQKSIGGATASGKTSKSKKSDVKPTDTSGG
ncbi:MAG TPA: DUF4142 domain-containing protein [Nevskiaceae bacterium]|nr:DUF4142 domain-containing protein [Nevskiaceae bacterium]